MDFTPLMSGINRLVSVIETNNRIQEKALAMLAVQPGSEPAPATVPAAATVPASPPGTANPVHTSQTGCRDTGTPGTDLVPGPGTTAEPAGMQANAIDYDSLELQDLKKLCAKRGIELPKGTKTPTYIKELKAWDILHPNTPAPLPPSISSETAHTAITQDDILAALTSFRDAAQLLPIETVNAYWPSLAGIPGHEEADVNAANLAILWVRQLMTAGTQPGESVPDIQSIKPENYTAVMQTIAAKKTELGIG